MKIPTITDAVRFYFEHHPEFDGLYADGGECGCRQDNLAPCGMLGDCEFGHAVPCGPECDHDRGEPMPDDWHIVPGPRPAVA
jgi:hypothetical protein